MSNQFILQLRERFDLQHKQNGAECWPWTGTIGAGGYGYIKESGRLRLAHRIAWRFANGEVPTGMLVCHKCDVRHCVNPSHLFLGTARDNVRDMMKKGRHRPSGRTKAYN